MNTILYEIEGLFVMIEIYHKKLAYLTQSYQFRKIEFQNFYQNNQFNILLMNFILCKI